MIRTTITLRSSTYLGLSEFPDNQAHPFSHQATGIINSLVILELDLHFLCMAGQQLVIEEGLL